MHLGFIHEKYEFLKEQLKLIQIVLPLNQKIFTGIDKGLHI